MFNIEGVVLRITGREAIEKFGRGGEEGKDAAYFTDIKLVQSNGTASAKERSKGRDRGANGLKKEKKREEAIQGQERTAHSRRVATGQLEKGPRKMPAKGVSKGSPVHRRKKNKAVRESRGGQLCSLNQEEKS